MSDHSNTRRRSFLKGAAAVAGFGVATTTVSAETLTVSDGESLQAAVDDADSGDTIEVGPGTYPETVVLPDDKALTLVGNPGDESPGAGSDAPLLYGDHGSKISAFLLPGSGSEPVEIRGFTIRAYGTVPDKLWGKGVSVRDRSNLTVEDCTFEDIGGQGVTVFSDGSFRPANWVIRRNRFVSIDHSAVHLSANQGAVVANNVVESGPFEVNDSPNRWWEENTEDHNPKAGIEVHATGRNGNNATLSGIDIVGNYITGTYDDTGIRVLSINKNGADADPNQRTETLATDIEIRANTVDITDELDDDGEGDGFVDGDDDERDESGILIGANPEAGPPAFVDGVEVVGNTVRVAQTGVGIATRSPCEIRNVQIRDNVLVDGILGVSLNGHGPDVLHEVTVEGNEATGNAAGVSLFNGTPPGGPSPAPGSPYNAVIVTENQLTDNRWFGVLAGGDRALDGAIVHRNDIQDNAVAGARNNTPGTLSACCNFWGHATGPESDDNRKGQGNGVIGDVDYEPWIPQSYTKVPEQACKLENHRNE